ADGQNAFSFGRLHGLEQQRADEAEREFNAAWKRLASKKVDRWIRT
ncbi:MAG: hypothetical protein JWP24_1919, partial [Marmoricola sp.]|nr:hypothetical protein [Marmoricola sp.]